MSAKITCNSLTWLPLVATFALRFIIRPFNCFPTLHHSCHRYGSYFQIKSFANCCCCDCCSYLHFSKNRFRVIRAHLPWVTSALIRFHFGWLQLGCKRTAIPNPLHAAIGFFCLQNDNRSKYTDSFLQKALPAKVASKITLAGPLFRNRQQRICDDLYCNRICCWCSLVSSSAAVDNGTAHVVSFFVYWFMPLPDSTCLLCVRVCLWVAVGVCPFI